MKYLITERQYRLLLEENIYPSEEEYRQALKDVDDLISKISFHRNTTDHLGRPLNNGFKPREIDLNNYSTKFKSDIERGGKFFIEILKSYAETEKHKNAADIIFNYHKKTWDEEKERSKRVIDLNNQYESGNITHNAKPGDVIWINHGHGGEWIYGEVYLTQGNDICYHGGFIPDIETSINKKGGIYVTRSLRGAWRFRVKVKPLHRVYEVKIKSGSLFIDSSPAGQDHDGLKNEKEALKPLGIVGMADKNFRYGKHAEGKGTTGSEGLILDISAIESFRAIPYSELLDNEYLKSFSEYYKNMENWYNSIKDLVFRKYFIDEFNEKHPNDVFADNIDDFKNLISRRIDDKINSLSDYELVELQDSIISDKELAYPWIYGK